MIDIKNLSKDYGTILAVDNLSLQVPKGELFCFLGPNGAGKTTTIKILTGLLKPTSGTATIDGIDITEDPINAKKGIGYIPDMPYLYERLTTTEFFIFTGQLYDIPEATIKAELQSSFELFGLLEHSKALVKDLSHGLKQRLIYASTLLHRPKVMFVDEPLIGLDPYTIRLIKDLLKNHTRAGMTIFLTTHILALAEDIADRIAIINHGKILAMGTLEELRKKHGGTDLEDLFLKLTGGTEKPDTSVKPL
jgi:ABC-2 type transport system ATP-binding protein